MNIDILLRIISAIIFISWLAYWLFAEKNADREKPKTKNISFFHKNNIKKIFMRIFEVILILQFFGLSILPIKNASVDMQLIGLFLIVIGVSISITARKELGTNWAHAYEYQVKQRQELVTTGIYSYIRHPIYAGLIFAIIGGEMVARSYLIFVVILFIIGLYHQAKLEEKFLLSHFGEHYKTYMKRTKMFIPYLW